MPDTLLPSSSTQPHKDYLCARHLKAPRLDDLAVTDTRLAPP